MTKSTRASSFAHSVRCAVTGIAWAFRTQRNVRIQFAVAAVVTGAAFAIGVPLIQIAILALAITAVLVAELLNSAIEATIDLISPDVHPLARIAKDAAAGGVLMAAGGATAVGLLIFGARVYAMVVGTI